MTLVNIVSISYPNRATIASMMIAAMTAPKPAACFLCFDSAKAAEIGAHHRPRALNVSDQQIREAQAASGP
jgi:hypothetical protein